MVVRKVREGGENRIGRVIFNAAASGQRIKRIKHLARLRPPSERFPVVEAPQHIPFISRFFSARGTETKLT